MNPITIFRGTSGLNTVADPARIPMANDAISDVAEIVNMRIDQYGRPSKRPNFELIQAGSFHSLFTSTNNSFVIQTRSTDDAIMKINSDNSLTGIASGLSIDQKMSWCNHGELTYFSNTNQQGIINNDSVNDWVVGDYFGPETNREFIVPENINHLEIHSGKMFVSVDNILYWSEQHRFDLFSIADSFIQFHDKITMIRSVVDGLFIGTEKQTYFLVGNNPNEFILHEAANFSVIEHSDAQEKVEVGDLGLNPSLGILWTSPEGTILGLPTGIIINLNKKKIIYPENYTSGFGCLIGYEFIHGMF